MHTADHPWHPLIRAPYKCSPPANPHIHTVQQRRVLFPHPPPTWHGAPTHTQPRTRFSPRHTFAVCAPGAGLVDGATDCSPCPPTAYSRGFNATVPRLPCTPCKARYTVGVTPATSPSHCTGASRSRVGTGTRQLGLRAGWTASWCVYLLRYSRASRRAPPAQEPAQGRPPAALPASASLGAPGGMRCHTAPSPPPGLCSLAAILPCCRSRPRPPTPLMLQCLSRRMAPIHGGAMAPPRSLLCLDLDGHRGGDRGQTLLATTYMPGCGGGPQGPARRR